MEFRTRVDIPKLGFEIAPREEMLFVGSCFADSIGQRFVEEQFRATVNPYGVMYNPVSILHTVQRFCTEHPSPITPLGQRTFATERTQEFPKTVFLTLGTNHIYRLKETGEIMDNCQKLPAALFQEELLTVDECADALSSTVALLRSCRPDVHVVFTVSPIRYRKYGYHESQLSKATLLLAVDKVIATHSSPFTTHLHYFPAYEIVLDELRDYRFYKEDMLHPSSQAVEYIWERLVEHYFSPAAKQFLSEWAPLKAALNHRPFNPDSEEYRQFIADTRAKADALLQKWD